MAEPIPEKMEFQSENPTKFTHIIFPDQLKKKEMEEMIHLLLKPEVKQGILRKEKQLKEEEWKECEARILGLEEKYEIFNKEKEKVLPYMEGNVEAPGGSGGEDMPVTPLMKWVEEQTGLFRMRVGKARGRLPTGNDSDPNWNTEINFTDVLGLTDIDNISHVVDFMTGRAIRDLIYDIPEVTDLYLMADSIYQKGKADKNDSSEEEVASLRDKVRSWILKTVHLKETLKSWLEDSEVVNRKPTISVPRDQWIQLWVPE